MKQGYAKILDECSVVATDRGESYGPVEENFKNISKIYEQIFDGYMTPVEICQVMIAVKTARQRHKHKADNVIDLINYWAIYLYLKNLEGAK